MVERAGRSAWRSGRAWLVAAGLLLLLTGYGQLPGVRFWRRNLVEFLLYFRDTRRLDVTSRGAPYLGDAWRLARLAAERTPPDARILIPTGPEHEPISNLYWSLYYLYPRRLVTLKETGPAVAGRADFVLVHDGWGRELAGQPPDSVAGIRNGVLEIVPPGESR